MPITDIGSYPPTMQEFIEHWTDVNVALAGLGDPDFKLKGGRTVAMFTADRAALEAIIIQIEGDTTLKLAMQDRDLKKEAIRVRMTQFRGGVENLLSETKYPGALPTMPGMTSDESRYLRPFDEMANLWAIVNTEVGVVGFVPPLILAGSYDLADFVAELAVLRAAYKAVAIVEDNQTLAIRERDLAMRNAHERMKIYRVGVVSVLPEGNALLNMIPALTPPSGPVLEPVVLTGIWNGTTVMADLTWTASTDANLGHYSVRYSESVPYDPANEIVLLAPLPPTQAFATDHGLTNPTDTARFRVYAVRTTGAEAGSNVVTVVRP